MTCWLNDDCVMTVGLVTADNIFWFTSMFVQNEPQNSGHGTGKSGRVSKCQHLLNLHNLLRRYDFRLKHRPNQETQQFFSQLVLQVLDGLCHQFGFRAQTTSSLASTAVHDFAHKAARSQPCSKDTTSKAKKLCKVTATLAESASKPGSAGSPQRASDAPQV